MLEYISVALILLITLPRIKFSFKNFNLLSKENSSNVKGLLCILIFYHHFTGWFVDKGIIFYVLSHIGSFVVGVFFFLSAYGLIKAYPGDVNFSFLLKRFVKILVPYWLCEILYSVISLAFDIQIKCEVNFKNIFCQSKKLLKTLGLSGQYLWHMSCFLSAKKYCRKLTWH